MAKCSKRQTLVRLLALTSGYPLLGAQAQSVWEPISLPQSEQLRWQPLPNAARTAGVQWERLPIATKEPSSIVWQPLEEDNDTLLATPQKLSLIHI